MYRLKNISLGILTEILYAFAIIATGFLLGSVVALF